VATRIETFLTKHRLRQNELAALLGLDPSAISKKVAGRSPWKLDEILRVLAWASEMLGRPVTFDEVFGPADAPELVGPSNPAA
jgi:transcriptional regulator with XRE-family HTH domain